jgi:hypothetical protein
MGAVTRLSVALLVLLAACTGAGSGSEREAGPPGPPGSDSRPPESHALYFLRRASLSSFELSGRKEDVLGDLASSDAAMSPDTHHLVVVREGSPLGPSAEGYREPELVLMSPGGTASEPLGVGRTPMWSADGRRVAAIAPASGEECAGVETEGTGCGGEKVISYDPSRPGPAGRVIAGPAAAYSLLGWAGDEILALRAPGVTVLGDHELPLEPAEVWGASPDGDALLRANADAASFLDVSTGRPLARVDLDGAALGDGAWSFDGANIGVVLVRAAGTRLALIDSGTGAVVDVPDSSGAQGQVVWTANSSRFAFVRVDPADAGKLQVVTCTIGLDCRSLFSFRQGVRLLGLN